MEGPSRKGRPFVFLPPAQAAHQVEYRSRTIADVEPMSHRAPMWFLLLKAAISGILIAIISEVSKRYPGFGGLIASLPLVSVLGMMWLWHDRPDAENMAAHAQATFWFVLPSLPMFLLIPFMLRHGIGFWLSLVAGCLLTITVWAGPRFGLRL
jgi:DNA-binding transcriptional LysR family regulator